MLRMARLGLTALAAAVAGCVGGAPPPPGAEAGGLLAGRKPTAAPGVTGAERLTDGVAAVEGDHWRTDVTAVLSSGAAFAEWDLGRPARIRAAFLQADNNDRYLLSVSQDGREWTRVWEIGPVRNPGMHTHLNGDLDHIARFVRLSATGRGDGRWSVGELGLLAEAPDPASWPPRLDRRKGTDPRHSARSLMKVFAAATILLVVLHHRRIAARRWLALLIAAPPAAAAVALSLRLAEIWPLEEAELTLLRALIAAAAATAVAREALPWRRFQADRRLVTGVLAVLAVAAVGCFYRMGSPQFVDEAKGRRTLVHPWDMRVYFPLAKYFRELRFDGLYLASLAAYLDNDPGLSPSDIGHVLFRDLRDNEMRRAREQHDRIDAVRRRFSPERWDAFKKDMKYFRDLMGRGGYLGSLRDHGGNATPVWLLPAHAIFRDAPANELTLTLSGLIDPLLLFGLFAAIGRTYGVRPMLAAMLVFGTTDFSRFGTNLMGSTLRMDWMAALGFGACALKRGRFALGGVLLAYAGLIRAFPAMAALFLPVPALWWAADLIRVRRRLPSAAEVAAAQRPALRTMAGAVAGVLSLVALSSVGPLRGSWVDWADKIKIHAEKPNVNSVGVRNLASFESRRYGARVIRPDLPEPWTDWQSYQLAALERRRPAYYAAMAAFVALALLACRGRRLDQAALCGLLLIPVVFYPANYYCHYVFLLPLVATDTRRQPGPEGDAAPPRGLFTWTSFVLLAMCVAQYPTLTSPGIDVIYTRQSAVLMAAFAAILLPLAWTAWRSTPSVVSGRGP